MKLLRVDRMDEAREKLNQAAEECLFQKEMIDAADALGRILAEDILANEPVPAFRRSSVDGYAVRSSDLAGASDGIPVFLKVIGEVCLGECTEIIVKSGTCAYVATGGMIPEGADAMVMIEYCEEFSADEIAVYTSEAPGASVVQIGEDMKPGDIVLPAGRKVRPQDIGALAAMGVMEIWVFRPWKVTILSTGDELIPPGEMPRPGQIRDINTSGLRAQAQQEGMEIISCRLIKDVREELVNAFEEAKKTSDLIVISGGSSQGKKDMTAEIIEEHTSEGVLTHGLALKPGKPTILGYDRETHTIAAGLPGHPAAAMMVFEQFFLWFWRKRTGQKEELLVTGRMSTNLASAPGKRTFQPVKILEGEDGIREVVPVLGKSGMITTLTRADGYLVMEENQEGVKAGEAVKIHLWR